MIILIPTLVFRVSNPKSTFEKIWAKKVKVFYFSSKLAQIGTHSISRMMILIPTLVLWISNPKSIFGQIWVKKVKIVRFTWKLAHMLSWGWWFLLTLVFWISNPKFIFQQVWAKKSQSCLFCLKIGTRNMERMLTFIPTLIFLNFQPWIHFWANLGWKNQNNYIYDFIFPQSLTLLQFWGTVCLILYLCFVSLSYYRKESQYCSFCLKIGRAFEDNDSYSNINFLNFQS